MLLGALVVSTGCEAIDLVGSNMQPTRIVTDPQNASLESSQTQQFEAYGITTAGDTVSVAVSWWSSGGVIADDGLFTAPSTGGSYDVVATDTSGTLADTSTVSVAYGTDSDAEPLFYEDWSGLVPGSGGQGVRDHWYAISSYNGITYMTTISGMRGRPPSHTWMYDVEENGYGGGPSAVAIYAPPPDENLAMTLTVNGSPVDMGRRFEIEMISKEGMPWAYIGSVAFKYLLVQGGGPSLGVHTAGDGLPHFDAPSLGMVFGVHQLDIWYTNILRYERVGPAQYEFSIIQNGVDLMDAFGYAKPILDMSTFVGVHWGANINNGAVEPSRRIIGPLTIRRWN